MSFVVDVEHIWLAKESLPMTIQGVFHRGACTVWADEKFVAAIPASNDEAGQLADLIEAGEDPEYFALRDRLCGEHGYQRTSLLFKTEMEKLRRQDSLASAARRNN